LLFVALVAQFCCNFSLFLLLTAQHTSNHVTHLLPAQSLQYIEVESNLEEEDTNYIWYMHLSTEMLFTNVSV